jgi:menaquinone-dependent protoporphyrinogen oxidase
MKATKVLIVYNSTHGHTRRIAKRMREAASKIENVDVNIAAVGEANESDVAIADQFIIAGPVHFGRHDRKLGAFVREHLGAMAARSSALVSISGKMASFNGQAEAKQYADDFLEATGWNPDRVELVAGAVQYTRYNFLLRWVMKRIATREGLDTDTSRDYDYTDWDAVDRFAREFITKSRAAAA